MAIRIDHAATADDPHLTNTAVLSYAADYAIGGWVYTTADGANSCFVELGDSTSNYDYVRFDTAEKLRIYSRISGTNEINGVTGATTLSDGWHHIMLVRTGAVLDLYLNGVLECTGENTSVVSDRLSASRLSIGDTYASTSTQGYESLYGWIAYDAALTAQEVLSQMKHGATALRRSNLWGEWPMLAGSARTDDISGHGRDWTENGTVTEVDPPTDVPFRGQEWLGIVVDGGGSDVTATPGAASLTVTGYAPTVDISGDIAVTPGIETLAITGYAPSVSVSDHVAVTPDTVDIVITGYPVTVDIGGGVTVVPDAVDIVVTGLVPTVSISVNVVVIPPPGEIIIIGYPPSLGAPVDLTPDAVDLAITTFEPLVRVGREVFPETTDLVLTGYDPTVETSTPKAVVTAGYWSDQVFFQPGDEWMVTLSGPSASDVSVRVVVTFEDFEQ